MAMSLGKGKLAKRVALLKRVGLFDNQNHDVVVRRAISMADLAEAYTLVHDVFVEQGYIHKAPTGIRVRAFEALPQMVTFLAQIAGKTVAVMSIVQDSAALGLPSDKAFAKEIGVLRAQGRRVCEITNLAVLSEYRRSNAFPELTRATYAQARAWHCDDEFIAISPGHATFFEDVLQFEHCGDLRTYSAEKMDLVEGKRVDLRMIGRNLAEADASLAENAFLWHYYFDGNPYHVLVNRWAVMAQEAFGNPTLLRDLFVTRSKLLLRCKPGELDVLCGRWGTELFARVLNECTLEDRDAILYEWTKEAVEEVTCERELELV
jgi:hypothetical protein